MKFIFCSKSSCGLGASIMASIASQNLKLVHFLSVLILTYSWLLPFLKCVYFSTFISMAALIISCFWQLFLCIFIRENPRLYLLELEQRLRDQNRHFSVQDFLKLLSDPELFPEGKFFNFFAFVNFAVMCVEMRVTLQLFIAHL